ncbi:MAG: DUF523 and DUF1722 domain-containing protein [Myxococcota bacterium]|jgi:uncharacterized protein YbgA (DUF1722 family)/uncharacterized protein YbbK (DUF523 family)|nr:DUF523 and DUF1722 domain-containing protein [Myxococcota bacterium]
MGSASGDRSGASSGDSAEAETIRIGTSSCLLGYEVRFDGGHKRDRFMTDQIGPFVEWVPVCPEAESGMSIPRPTLRLVTSDTGPRLVETRSGVDHTRSMKAYTTRRLRQLKKLDLCGYILKKGSPSCGMARVKVYSSEGMPTAGGSGLFASGLLEAFPDLPVEEEGRLHDSKLRENFIERVFAYRRLQTLFASRWTAGSIIAFHSTHKLQLMAHSNSAYRELGRLVAEVKKTPRKDFKRDYSAGFTRALRQMATPGRNANALQHAAGHLKKLVDSGSRVELAEVIHEYRTGLIPLVVPITLLRHHVRGNGLDYLADQTYLAPHPKELMLRNHV